MFKSDRGPGFRIGLIESLTEQLRVRDPFAAKKAASLCPSPHSDMIHSRIRSDAVSSTPTTRTASWEKGQVLVYLLGAREQPVSVNIGRILGIPIRIHWTLWLVFLLISWSLAVGYLPATYPRLSATLDWIVGAVSALLLFVSVLVHELSHSYIAKKNGLPIARITLFFFGGVSEMTEEPKDAGLEVRMALAGPLTSFAIAAILGALWYVGLLVSFPTPVIAVLGYNAIINAALGAFNLIPAFPLDGGRVLRGSLWRR